MPADTSFGWKSEAAFLASVGSKSVLPQKVIHVDDAGPSPAAELTAGGLYVADSITRQAAVAREPRMACPNCGQTVSGLAGAKPQYEIPQTNAPCLPLGDNTIEPPRMLYSLEPCGCKASQEWAAAFSAELNRRMEGADPKPVIDMTEKERQARKQQLEQRISKLYSAQSKATLPEHKDAIQYRLVILTDQLMRLLPGTHNQVPAVKLNPKVEQWASTKGYHKPPEPVEFKPLDPQKQASQFLDAMDALTDSLFKGFGLPPAMFNPGGASTNPDNADVKSKLKEMKQLLAEKNPSKFMKDFADMYKQPDGLFKKEWLESAMNNPPPPGKGVYIDPATNLVHDEQGNVIGIPLTKPGDDIGYGSAYPMPKNLGSSAMPPAVPKAVSKPLGSVPVPPGKVMEDHGAANALHEKLLNLQGMASEILQKRNMHSQGSPAWNEYQQQYMQLLGSVKATENQLAAMLSVYTTYKPLAKVAETAEAKAATEQLQEANQQVKKTLSSIIGNTTVEELIVIFGADKFQLPKQWLTHLLNSITVNKVLFTEVIKKIVGSTNLADIATRGVFIEKNLKNHRDKGESLAPLTVQFLAVMCKTMCQLGTVVVAGPAQTSVAGTEQPPVQTEEQFHDQFKRKRRRIRKIED